MGTHKSGTTAYHPQYDGLVERHNRTIQDMLSAFVSGHSHDWDMWIDIVIHAYIVSMDRYSSTHESTGIMAFRSGGND